MKQTSLTQAFWDYNYGEKEILEKLKRGTKEEKIWIIGRIIENLPYDTIWRYITLSQLKQFFPYLRIRPQLKRRWSYTLALWEKHEQTTH